jgi:hypothetical protein
MNPRVARIIDVKPFLITVEWTNGEKKSIDFAEFLADEKNKKSIHRSKQTEEHFIGIP